MLHRKMLHPDPIVMSLLEDGQSFLQPFHKPVIHLGNSNFVVPWVSHGPNVDLSNINKFPNLLVNGSGHSHTLQFEKMERKHKPTPPEYIADQSAFTGDDIVVLFSKQTNKEIDDRPEPPKETSPICFCTTAGAFSMGCHDMPSNATVYTEGNDIEMTPKIFTKKKRVCGSKFGRA